MKYQIYTTKDRGLTGALAEHKTIYNPQPPLESRQECAFWELRNLLDTMCVPYGLTEVATARGDEICATLRVGDLELNLDASGAVRAELVPHDERKR